MKRLSSYDQASREVDSQKDALLDRVSKRLEQQVDELAALYNPLEGYLGAGITLVYSCPPLQRTQAH